MKERTKSLLSALGIITLTSGFFFAVFNIIAEKTESRQTRFEQDQDEERTLMMIQERRTSEMQGWVMEGNPES